ncbi:TSUP family transporter [Lacibacterium aquatile]|uniref:Probable membrane transporter protein n=1 Tax=Lacibacterium aquatile TaxID=1168082 RepID=A0ABW5DWF9_9PROT
MLIDGFGLDIALLLFVVAMVAGFIDSIAGGGGLLVIPVLFSVGVPPAAVFGTTKLQASCGSFSASLTFIRRGEVNLREMLPIIALTFAGSLIGAAVLAVTDPELLRDVVPFLLIAIAFYMLFAKKTGEADAHRRLSPLPFAILFGLGLGFYDGFFGPGTGTFWALAYVAIAGYSLRRATAHAKIVNFTSNISAFLMLTLTGQVLWGIGILMACGQIIGARLGAGMVITNGAKIVRPMLVLMSLAITARLLWDNPDHPISAMIVKLHNLFSS